MEKIFRQIKEDIADGMIYNGYGFLQGTYEDNFDLELVLDGDYFMFYHYDLDCPEDEEPEGTLIRIKLEDMRNLSVESLVKLYNSEYFYS